MQLFSDLFQAFDYVLHNSLKNLCFVMMSRTEQEFFLVYKHPTNKQKQPHTVTIEISVAVWLTVLWQILYHDDGSVKGIATNDVGIHKDGSPKVCLCNSFCVNFV